MRLLVMYILGMATGAYFMFMYLTSKLREENTGPRTVDDFHRDQKRYFGDTNPQGTPGPWRG